MRRFNWEERLGYGGDAFLQIGHSMNAYKPQASSLKPWEPSALAPGSGYNRFLSQRKEI